MQKYNSILKKFENILSQQETSSILSLQDVHSSYAISCEYLNQLKIEFLSDKSISDQSEINFFKIIKPSILSKVIFYSFIERLIIETRNLSEDGKKKVYEQNILLSSDFLLKNQIYQSYFDSNDYNIDSFHFKRNSSRNILLGITEFREHDINFTTQFDVLLSLIKAHEYFRAYIHDIINPVTLNSSNTNSNIEWTFSKMDLTELIYALETLSCFGDGKASITDIAKALCPQANIKEIYRNYTMIKLRQGNSAKFIRQLAKALEQRIKEDID